MDKNSLVILRGSKDLNLGTDTFTPNKAYRCLESVENTKNGYIVYGIWFSKSEFNKNFEFAYDRIVRDLVGIGLIINNKVVSKNKFKQMADVHQYKGYRVKPFYIAFFKGVDILYGFYPCFRESKTDTLNYTYENLVKFFEGDLYPVDQDFIQLGNKGIPISGGNLGSW
jgi:hypothetical protein